MVAWISGGVAAVMTIAIWWMFPYCVRLFFRVCRLLTEKAYPATSLTLIDQKAGNITRCGDPLEAHLQRFSDGKAVYRALYIGTRLMAGLCAATLPFLILKWPEVSIALSLCVVFAVILDRAFGPRGKLELNLVAEQKLRELIDKKNLDDETRLNLLGQILSDFNKGYIQQLKDMDFMMAKVEIQPKS